MSAFGWKADMMSTARVARYDFFLTKKLVSAAAKNLGGHHVVTRRRGGREGKTSALRFGLPIKAL
jgi:hypothetical protein